MVVWRSHIVSCEKKVPHSALPSALLVPLTLRFIAFAAPTCIQIDSILTTVFQVNPD